MKLLPALIRLTTLLVSLLPLAAPAVGQERRSEAAAEQMQRLLVAEEAEARADAERWAEARGLPVRVRQPQGGWVELVGVEHGHPVYLTPHNRRAGEITRTARLYPGSASGLALTGRGLRLGIWDGGHVLDSHREFGGRVRFGDQAATDDHATHVGGTLVAAGIRAEARGMAYEASLVSYDWSNDASELSAEANGGLLVSNHSYGSAAGWYYGDVEGTGEGWYWMGDPKVSTEEDYRFGWYDAEATQFDRAAHANPHLLPVISAGNDRLDRGPARGNYRALDRSGQYQTFTVEATPRPPDGGGSGYDTITGAAGAKNVLTVGSVSVPLTGEPGGPSTFSSFGPTDDGRIKPDLLGVGEHLLSSRSSGASAYGYLSGTSMAAPTVAGSALLLQQYHQAVHGSAMRAATLKALLLHTARDLHLPGPDYQTGWGLLDAAAAAEAVGTSAVNRIALLEGQLVEGGTFARSVRAEGAGPIRVTLAWTDPPSARLPLTGTLTLDQPKAHLVNDLDLRVVDDATGETHLPYRLDRGNPSDPAVRGDNRVDPVEQVYIDAPEGASYTVVVTHKGALAGGASQPFSIVSSGLVDDLLPVAVTHVDAQAGLDGTALQWTTQAETTAGAFVVERAPVNYRSGGDREVGAFVELGQLPAQGGPDQSTEYRFDDTHFLAGRFAYRVVFTDGADRYTVGEVEVNVPPPATHAVLSNYPNPFSERTRLLLDLSGDDQVRVEVYDAVGRRVATVFEGPLPAGRHHLDVEAANWAPGVYVARVTTSRRALMHRMVLLR